LELSFQVVQIEQHKGAPYTKKSLQKLWFQQSFLYDNNDHIGILSNGLNWVSKWCKLSSTRELHTQRNRFKSVDFQRSFLYFMEDAILSSRLLISWFKGK
jgi:hypothetical protein